MPRVRRRGSGWAVREAYRPARLLAVALISGTLAAGCSSGDSRAPLAADVAQKGFANCIAAPDPGTAITRWDSPVWFALDMFVNESRSPLTIDHVSLIDPHNMALRGALVYEMTHSQHPLIQSGGLADLAMSVPAAYWARRQAVPGAVIAAGHATANLQPSYSLNLYEIVPEISLRKPGGGWALGERVTYRAGGQTYIVTAYTGYGIGVAPNSHSYCTPELKAINAAFRAAS